MVILASYSSALQGGFVWEDDRHVTENATLRDLEGLRRIWLQPEASPEYSPAAFSVMWIEHQLWQENPLGYHLLNILLHGLNAFLVFLIVRRLGIEGAFLAGLIFGVHPVHVESVAWISQLKSVLSSALYLAALLVYLYFAFPQPQQRRPPLAYALSLGLFLLALLSNTVTCTLPAGLLVVLWWKRGKFPLTDALPLLPYFALGLIFGLQTAHAEGVGVEAVERVLVAGRALWFYLWKLAWPAELIFSYPRWEIDSSAAWQYLFPLGALAVAVVLWTARHRVGRGPMAAVLFFAVTLFPALGFFNLHPMRDSFVADHRQYLASLGPIILVSAGLFYWVPRSSTRLRQALIGACGAIVLTLSWLTWQQGKIYQDRVTLFTDTIEKNQASWMAHLNRGDAYYKQSNLRAALKDYSRSIALNPRQLGSYIGRGRIYLHGRKYDLALEDFSQAQIQNPLSDEPHVNVGVVHVQQGQYDLALAAFDEAIRLNSRNPVSLLNRAILHDRAKRFEAALGDYAAALALDADNGRIYASRAQTYFDMGELEKSAADVEKARALGAAVNPGLLQELGKKGWRVSP